MQNPTSTLTPITTKKNAPCVLYLNLYGGWGHWKMIIAAVLTSSLGITQRQQRYPTAAGFTAAGLKWYFTETHNHELVRKQNLGFSASGHQI